MIWRSSVFWGGGERWRRGTDGVEIESGGEKAPNKTNTLASSRRHQTKQIRSLPFAHLIMATVRLRKAFRYPEDSEEDRQELDEEEQEEVIQQLQRQNDARNSQFSVRQYHSPFGPPRLKLCLSFLDALYGDPLGLGDGLPALRALCIKTDPGSTFLSGDPFPVDNGLHHEAHSPPSRSKGQKSHLGRRPTTGFGSHRTGACQRSNMLDLDRGVFPCRRRFLLRDSPGALLGSQR